MSHEWAKVTSANGGIALRLQSARLVAAVAEFGSLEPLRTSQPEYMKTTIGKHILSAFAALFVVVCSLRAGEFDRTPGVHFDDSQKIDVQGVLVIYKAFSSSELVMDSRAAKVVTPIKWEVEYGKSFSREDALKLMEKTLLEKAGIVLTRLDDKRVSVTYNDALPIKKAKTDQ